MIQRFVFHDLPFRQFGFQIINGFFLEPHELFMGFFFFFLGILVSCWVLIRFLSVRVQLVNESDCSFWRIVVLISSNLVLGVLVEMYKFQEYKF